jgi:hypothetical protein
MTPWHRYQLNPIKAAIKPLATSDKAKIINTILFAFVTKCKIMGYNYSYSPFHTDILIPLGVGKGQPSSWH